MKSAITSFTHIERREIPSLERRGAVGQRVIGEIVVIAFHHGNTDIETSDGTPVNASETLRNCKAGLSDAVVLGSIQDGEKAVLLDVMMVDRRSQRGKPWRERLDVLEKLHGRLPSSVQKKFPIAPKWTRGLMTACDTAPMGGGILLRVPGKAKGFLCLCGD